MDYVSPIGNNESEFLESNSAHTNPKSSCPRIRIVFEFSVVRPKLTYYRAVQGIDGGFRMERRGVSAKKFKAVMWTGSEESIRGYLKTVEWCYGTQNLSSVSYPETK